MHMKKMKSLKDEDCTWVSIILNAHLYAKQGEEDGHNSPIATGQQTSHASINMCSRIISFPLAELPKWKASHHATLLLTTFFFPVSPSLPPSQPIVCLSSCLHRATYIHHTSLHEFALQNKYFHIVYHGVYRNILSSIHISWKSQTGCFLDMRPHFKRWLNWLGCSTELTSKNMQWDLSLN